MRLRSSEQSRAGADLKAGRDVFAVVDKVAGPVALDPGDRKSDLVRLCLVIEPQAEILLPTGTGLISLPVTSSGICAVWAMYLNAPSAVGPQLAAPRR